MKINRTILEDLKLWKISKKRKPLLLQGARQVGKTFIMKAFGQAEFDEVVYVNFESSENLKALFTNDFNIERIVNTLAIEHSQTITATNTLIILDEIQEAEKGLTALKYFYENAPQYYIVAAGSLLGVSMQHKHAFPIGKVDILKLHPISFMEFAQAICEPLLYKALLQKNWTLIEPYHHTLVDALRLYYYVGGMPEAVADYVDNRNLNSVRAIQQKIIIGYQNDFAKYAPTEIVPRLRLVWLSIISQLAKENKKYIYGQIKNGARAKDFELAISWLVDAGLVIKVNRVLHPKIPLNSYQDMDVFKLYLVDIGLLNAMANLDQQVLLEKNKILIEFKGALTEQYVCQQLHIHHELYYWTAERSIGEIDFLVQQKNKIIPIEAKAEENLKAKSLKVFAEKYSIETSLKATMNQYKQQDWVTNYALYAVGVMLG